MDEETIVGICFVLFLLFIFTLPLSITACIAASTTRKWANDKAKARGIGGAEAVAERDPLVEDSESEEEVDFIDSEDEEFYHAKREQKREEREAREADLRLSTRAKFIQEWKRCWHGPGGSDEQRSKARELKEQDERRKIAREAVREYIRMERKKARKAQKQQQLKQSEKDEGLMELPTYGNAVGESAKQ